MVCLLFPEKLQYDGAQYRTPRTNAIIEFILLINNELSGHKTEKGSLKENLSAIVARRGIEPLFEE